MNYIPADAVAPRLHFATPPQDESRMSFEVEARTMLISDVRGHSNVFTLGTHGVAFRTHESVADF
jgi:hypothetical protein